MKPAYLCVKTFLLLAIGTTLAGCPAMNDPYAPSPYDSGYRDDRGYRGYDGRRDDYYRERDYDRKQDLERERKRLEDERERLEREREQQDQYRRNDPPPTRAERCPSGFSPSERKCSSDERRQGCRDMRLPGGLGCVSR